MLKARLIPFEVAPGALKPMIELEKNLKNSGLEHSLIELVKTRASQINGCAYCIHMHTKDARANGESEERLYLLSAWRESPLYSDRERAALAWTESLTRIADGHVPEAVYDRVRSHFSEKEIADLTYAVATINAWNRLGIALRAPEAGSYKPAKH